MSALCAHCIAFPNQCLLFRVKYFQIFFYRKHCAQTWLHRSMPAVMIYRFLCLSLMETLICYASNKFEGENPISRIVFCRLSYFRVEWKSWFRVMKKYIKIPKIIIHGKSSVQRPLRLQGALSSKNMSLFSHRIFFEQFFLNFFIRPAHMNHFPRQGFNLSCVSRMKTPISYVSNKFRNEQPVTKLIFFLDLGYFFVVWKIFSKRALRKYSGCMLLCVPN